MRITLDVQGKPDVVDGLRTLGREAPFVMSRALDDTANAAQRAIQDTLPQHFTLRRADFIKRTIYRARPLDFARTDRLQAVVRVNPDRDMLALHEDGGDKTPRSGAHVAIPLPAIKRNKVDVITRAQRPAALRFAPNVRKIETPSGIYLVRNRPGKGKGRLVGWRTEFLYKLKSSVPIRPRLAFFKTANTAIDDAFVRLALLRIDNALAKVSK